MVLGCFLACPFLSVQRLSAFALLLGLSVIESEDQQHLGSFELGTSAGPVICPAKTFCAASAASDCLYQYSPCCFALVVGASGWFALLLFLLVYVVNSYVVGLACAWGACFFM